MATATNQPIACCLQQMYENKPIAHGKPRKGDKVWTDGTFAVGTSVPCATGWAPTLLCSSCWLSSCSRTICSWRIISDRRRSFSRNVSPASAWCRTAAPSITALLTAASVGEASERCSPALWTKGCPGYPDVQTHTHSGKCPKPTSSSVRNIVKYTEHVAGSLTDKLTVAQLIERLPAFCESQNFITAFTGITTLSEFPAATAGRMRPQVAYEEDRMKMWRAAVNILDKQSRTAEKGWSSGLCFGPGADNSPP